uniref:DUF3540 domain-containing protein n=1 Tax=Candidatus Electrothrix sp. TaxID=2170559 RepID=UPI004056AFAF
MKSSAEKIIPLHGNTPPGIRECSVLAAQQSGEFRVSLDGRSRRAKQAFSCLVTPEFGDIVLCSENIQGMLYILSIIERPGRQKMHLSFPADTNIQLKQGSLHVHAPDHISVASDNLHCFSKKAVHVSEQAIISYDTVTAKGNNLQASYTTVRLISKLINTIANQVIDRFKGYIRRTEEHDMVKAAQITRTAEGLHSMDAEHTILNSKECTKIDGEKILMG